MGGKTIVDGTAYDITPSKVVVGGTSYNITAGKAMVGGVIHDIKFQETVTFIPSSYIGGYVSNKERMYTNVSSNTYGRIHVYVMNDSNYGRLIFDTSSIPDNVTIDNVVFRVKTTCGNASSTYFPEHTVKPRRNTKSTPSYSTQDIPFRNASVMTFDGVVWTLAQIKDSPELYFYGEVTEDSPQDRYIDVYGAELEVTYSY